MSATDLDSNLRLREKAAIEVSRRGRLARVTLFTEDVVEGPGEFTFPLTYREARRLANALFEVAGQIKHETDPESFYE